MANHIYYELPADPIETTHRPLTSPQPEIQSQSQQPPSLPPRNSSASSPDNHATIRGVPADDPSAVPLPLFTRRSNSNLLSQTSANSTHNTTPTPSPNRPPIPTVESYETSPSENPSSLPRDRSDSSIHTGPALPPRRISQHNPNEIYYTRDSHRVVAYLIPLPKPIDVSDAEFPQVQSSCYFILEVH